SSLWQRCVLLGPIDIGLREWFADHRKARHELLEPDSRGPLLHPFVPNAAVELVRVVLAPIPEDDRTRRECVDFEQKRYELLKAGLAQRVSIPNEHTAVRRGGNLAGQTLPHEEHWPKVLGVSMRCHPLGSQQDEGETVPAGRLDVLFGVCSKAVERGGAAPSGAVERNEHPR